MSSDQADIKFEDADLYEKFMGVWSRMLGSKFIDWISPDQGKKIFLVHRGVMLCNGILFQKLFRPTLRKNCSSDRDKLLKFEAEG